MIYGLEAVTRPALSRAPDSIPARAFLTVIGAGYVIFNAIRRTFNREIQPLNFARAVHAARDRFTPRFAHRHAVDEVITWFHQSGFPHPEVLDWRAMPAAEHDDYRRNIGIRGKLSVAM